MSALPEIRNEIVALRNASAIAFPLADWTVVELSGSDARKFLHNFCTNEINKLDDGKTCEAFVCDLKGKILAHVLVLALPGKLVLLGTPGSATALVPHLTKYLLDADVTIRDQSDQMRVLCLQGDQLEEQIQIACGETIPVGPGSCGQAANPPVIVAGAHCVPEPGVFLLGDADAIARFQSALSPDVVTQGSAELFDLFRIAAGFPLHGKDITSDDLAQNAARTPQAISFTKGCYLGQEPIARLDALGHTNRELRGVLIESGTWSPGDKLFSSEKEAGTLTSVATLPASGRTIALAMVRTKLANPGTKLTAQRAGETAQATIVWPASGTV